VESSERNICKFSKATRYCDDTWVEIVEIYHLVLLIVLLL